MKPNFTLIVLLFTFLTGNLFAQTNQVSVSNILSDKQIQTAELKLKLAAGALNNQSPFSDNYCVSHNITNQYLIDNNLVNESKTFIEEMHALAANWNPNMKMVSGPIPIIFHVVHNPNNPAENVSDAIITGLFNQLNDDFQLQNGDASNARSSYGFTPYNADISFCMAQQDPNGNPLATPGIERTSSTEGWFDSNNGEENKMKYTATNGADSWDRTRYVNVWICDITNGAMSGTAGYAYLPSTSFLPPADIDGIVLDYNLGTYSGSRALTHEMGHFMGLNHTWEGTGSGTCGDDDGFSDTPFTSGPSFNQASSCSGNQTYCNSIQTQYENFMDYSSCAVMYTQMQSNYMNVILSGVRSSLLSSDGCNSSSAPTCGISASATTIGAGGSVIFSDASTGSPTGWSWDFDINSLGGATPSTSTSQNPGTVSFANQGTYTVELTVSNSIGSTTCTQDIIVTPPNCGITASATNVTQNGSVNFSNGSDPSTTSWSWDFDVNSNGGATPATSTSENPGNVSFANLGTYTIELTTQFPSGPCTTTTTVIVSASMGCDTLLNIADADTLAIYGDGATGYASGWNQYGDISKVEKYTGYSPNSHVNGAAIYFYGVTDGGNGATVDLVLYDDNAGLPGSLLSSSTYNLSNINTVLSGSGGVGVLNLLFNAPVDITSGTFYIGIELNNFGTGDNIGVVHNSILDPTANTAYEQLSNGTWSDMESTWYGAGYPWSLYVSPYVTDQPISGSAGSNITTTCAGGSIDFSATASNAIGYNWYTTGGTPATSTNQNETVTYATAGNYTAYLVLDGSCSGQIIDSVQIVITNGPTTTATGTNPGCAGNDGQIVVSATGGSAPYTYSVDGGSTFQSGTTFTGLSAGTYNIVSQDATGCQGTTSTTLNPGSGILTVISTSSNPSCGNTDGFIVTTVSGGIAPYTFSNDGGSTFNAGTSPYTFNSLGAATFNIVVADANGCQGTETVTLSNPSTPTEISAASNLSCNNANDGSIITSATGVAPFTFSTDGGTTFNAGTSPNTTSGLIAGTYNVVVKDANGCVSAISTITISEPTVVTHTSTTTNASCGTNNGTITITGSGGVSSYTYSNDNGATYQSSNSFTSLAANTYQVIIKDGNGCTSTVSTETITSVGSIVASIPSQANETCNHSNGSITVSGTGGATPYTYSIDGGTTFQSTGAFNNVAAGTYNVIIEDAGGCQGTNTVSISNTGGFTPIISADQTICIGSTVNLTSGGAGSGGTYSWDAGPTPTLADQTVNPTSTTIYTVTMTALNGCIETASVTITVDFDPTVVISPSTPVICNGESITLTASGAQTYSWNTGPTTASITVSPTNQTTYTVVGQNGACQGAPVTSTVTVNIPPTVIAGSDQTLIVAGGTINFSNAGSAATSYSWDFGDGGSSTLGSPSHTFSTAGTFTVILTGTLGDCSSSDTLTINVGFTGFEEVNLEESISAYPNPNNGEFNLSLNFPIEQSVEIRLFNTIGELLDIRKLNKVSSSIIEFNLGNNAEGFYFVNIKTNSGSITKRISIIK